MEPPLPAAAEGSGKPGRRSHRLWIVVAFSSVTDRISMLRETVHKYGSAQAIYFLQERKIRLPGARNLNRKLPVYHPVFPVGTLV
ncbi:hypothetical protein SBDP1_380038 [Syntrophobacter sp. SbD1]|nr:hypothetical protein SBDP1_380038 [Syntrophobacter sp. SbD1]